MQYKIRKISKSLNPDYDSYGVTMPKEIALYFSGCVFDVEISGNSILMTSGTKISFSKKEIKEYKFEDCKIDYI